VDREKPTTNEAGELQRDVHSPPTMNQNKDVEYYGTRRFTGFPTTRRNPHYLPMTSKLPFEGKI
jgi:hypothetical protein